jgi:hypothetical protein
MGYFVGRAKFEPKRSTLLMVAGLLSAMFFHGTYDFFLFLTQYSYVGMERGNQFLAGGALISFIVSLILCRKLIRGQRAISRQMFKPENTTKSV